MFPRQSQTRFVLFASERIELKASPDSGSHLWTVPRILRFYETTGSVVKIQQRVFRPDFIYPLFFVYAESKQENDAKRGSDARLESA